MRGLTSATANEGAEQIDVMLVAFREAARMCRESVLQFDAKA